MTTFPTLYPNSISFDHGLPQVSEYMSFGIGPVRFRHKDLVNGQTFTFTYTGLSLDDVKLIRTHYRDNYGTAGEFLIPNGLFGGVGVTDEVSTYRYVDTPKEEHFGIYYNITVTIAAVRGISTDFILDAGSAELPAEEAFDKIVFSGTAPFTLNGSNASLAKLVCNGS